MREASLKFVKWKPQVKRASWKESKDRGAERCSEAAFDNSAEVITPSEILTCSLTPNGYGRNWDAEMNKPAICQEV